MQQLLVFVLLLEVEFPVELTSYVTGTLYLKEPMPRSTKDQ